MEESGRIAGKIEISFAQWKGIKTFRKNLNEQGSADGSIDIAASAITGSYSLEVYNGNDVLLSSKNFLIEEFVPDRIKVTARLDKTELQPGESAKLLINAVNFFGPPAANRNYETEILVKQKSFNPRKFDKYDFAIANPGISFDKIVNQGKTDELGNASESFLAKKEYLNVGVCRPLFTLRCLMKPADP